MTLTVALLCVVYSRPAGDAQVLTVALLCVVYSRPASDAQVLTVALLCVVYSRPAGDGRALQTLKPRPAAETDLLEASTQSAADADTTDSQRFLVFICTFVVHSYVFDTRRCCLGYKNGIQSCTSYPERCLWNQWRKSVKKQSAADAG